MLLGERGGLLVVFADASASGNASKARGAARAATESSFCSISSQAGERSSAASADEESRLFFFCNN